ncbi:protein lin-9 homolog isoform X1 [Penaeus chinensis]|uniref:protein lin-9 homolog isoform X1 n=2 Tax=Penaeus TaxID=133894 RepID=UPI001FB605BA|nr:protein lin-9 homolog isoform X1 [Penaeus chinensis]
MHLAPQPHNMADTLESELGQSAEQQAELLLTFKNGGFSSSSSSSSSSAFSQSQEPQQDFSPLSALGLQRVGEERPSPSKEPSIQLNRRGMPARMRKKNRLYYDDDLVSSPTQMKSPKKTPRGTPKKQPNPQPMPLAPVKLGEGISAPHSNPVIAMEPQTITTPDKKVAQQNGVRLRNFLKLPQAHKWVYFEWFYSNIDKPLFGGENDFQIVLKEAFPQLQTRKLTRRQWGMIRRMMGKPRRCSQAFFQEERQSLDKKRHVLRLLQQRKITDINTLKDFPLPDQIPMQLVIGTKVTARIRKPENGLYTGVIDAVDTSDNTYRITFDRHGIGTHSIPDYEVLSSEVAEIMPLSSFSQKFRPRPPLGMVTPPRPLLPKLEPGSVGADSPALSLTNDPILAQSPLKSSKISMDDTLGGFPVRCLVQIVQLSKILRAKREKIGALRDMNAQAEKQRSYSQELNVDFQRRYAALVLDIEKLNRDLNQHLVVVQQFCQEIAPEQGLPGPTLLPGQIRERCYEEAATIVDVTNHSSGSPQVSSPAILDLITKLTSLMLQMKNLTETEVSAYELTSLQQTLNEIRSSLDESNRVAFQNNIEVHLTHIMSAVSQMGTLQAFNSHNGTSV